MEPGDLIEIDIPARSMKLLVDEATLAERRANWQPPQPKVAARGFLARYAKLVNSADTGAVLE